MSNLNKHTYEFDDDQKRVLVDALALFTRAALLNPFRCQAASESLAIAVSLHGQFNYDLEVNTLDELKQRIAEKL